ncbi:MAG: biotin--[acetyl-CoA-carboxylase] ligase [Cyanobacteria bacterium SIG31]|nr:biotin--[acetyl-CoA-carboxylase] ligase [Cyanobacteria bacterium SIG31]
MELLFLDVVDSTNKYAKEHLNELEDATIVYAGLQTAGRGRMQRKWDSNSGDNIYASIVLKPSNELKEVYSNLTQYLSLILAEVFEEYNILPKIKWPNDVRINGKKISGILAESVLEGNDLKGIVLGFGVNLNCKKDDVEKIDQPATSLNLETGMNIDREFFLKKVVDKFCLRYNKFIEEGFLLIKEDYIRRAEFLNTTVTVKVFDNEIIGFAKEITDNGALKIVDKNNKEHVLLIGDIL